MMLSPPFSRAALCLWLWRKQCTAPASGSASGCAAHSFMRCARAALQEGVHDPYKQQRIKLGGLAEHLETIRR